MSKILKRIKRRIKRAFDWLKGLFGSRRKPEQEVEPKAEEENGLKQRVAARCTETKERVAKRSKNLKTKVTGFFKKVGRWFKARFKRVKTFVNKATLEVARVFVPFERAFFAAAATVLNTAIVASLLATSSLTAVFTAVLANVGLRAIHKYYVEKATATLVADANKYDAVITEDLDLLNEALLDPEFREMHDTYLEFINGEDSAVLKYSKCPKLLRFVWSDVGRTTMYGGVLLGCTAEGIVCDYLNVPLETMQVVVPATVFAFSNVVNFVPGIVLGVASYRSSRKFLHIAKAMAEYIDTLKKKHEEEERQRIARWEARQEEERQRKYGKKGAKK